MTDKERTIVIQKQHFAVQIAMGVDENCQRLSQSDSRSDFGARQRQRPVCCQMARGRDR